MSKASAFATWTGMKTTAPCGKEPDIPCAVTVMDQSLVTVTDVHCTHTGRVPLSENAIQTGQVAIVEHLSVLVIQSETRTQDVQA